MTDQHDLERALRSFEHQAGPRGRDAAMRAFSERKPRGRVVWTWHVPLPIAVAGVALAATVAFMVGQHFSDGQLLRQAEPSEPVPIIVEEVSTVWTAATSDILADRARPVGRPGVENR